MSDNTQSTDLSTIEEVRQFLLDLIRKIRADNGDDPNYELLCDENFEIVGKTNLNLETKPLKDLILLYGSHENNVGFNDGVCK